jgi:hypothetical protein
MAFPSKPDRLADLPAQFRIRSEVPFVEPGTQRQNPTVTSLEFCTFRPYVIPQADSGRRPAMTGSPSSLSLFW